MVYRVLFEKINYSFGNKSRHQVNYARPGQNTVWVKYFVAKRISTIICFVNLNCDELDRNGLFIDALVYEDRPKVTLRGSKHTEYGRVRKQGLGYGPGTVHLFKVP